MPADLAYTVRRSARARSVRVRVEHDGEVRVTLPRRARDREAAAAVRELRPWIDRRLAEVDAARRAIPRTPGTVPVLGRELRLAEQPGRTRAHRRGELLLVPASGPEQRAAVERWYRRTARAEAAARLDAAAAALGTTYERLTIREQRTRWGSCSATGAIAINWRLLLGPQELLDYVVWHEACHLVVLDHSPRFWALLGRHLPGYEAQRRWLRDNGAALQL
ncbi:MAG TPA: SprT family zinc-dependent metalloprotease [Solirubrobacteraceae bacterium]|nr:SprT family zinc-dependent metalloprotease [Solirubrobacteraceae bacterium]